jgi:hypothetical protein
MSNRIAATKSRLQSSPCDLENERHADHRNDMLDMCLPRTAARQLSFTSLDKRYDFASAEQCTFARSGTAGAQTRRTRCAGCADRVISRYVVVERVDGIDLSA